MSDALVIRTDLDGTPRAGEGAWRLVRLEQPEDVLMPADQPLPQPPTGTADLVGWLQPSEGTGALDENPLDDVFPQLRIADLVQRLDNDLYAGYVVLREPVSSDAESADLVVADVEQLPEPGQFTALRTLLYAIEWWVFGAFALFIWWRYVRESTEEPAPPASAPTTA